METWMCDYQNIRYILFCFVLTSISFSDTNNSYYYSSNKILKMKV